MRSSSLSILVFFLFPLFAQKKGTDSAYTRAFAYAEQKNFDACLSALRPAIKDKEADKEMRLLAAHCHTAKKNYLEAVSHLRFVVKEHPETAGIREDIVALLLRAERVREARNAAYRFAESFKDDGAAIPHRLLLVMAWGDIAYGKPTDALAHARAAKQSPDNAIKYESIVVETRALIALGHLSEADIALSFAESMQNSEAHAMLRANIAEISWAGQKFPEEKRAEIIAGYEKLSRSENAEIKAAALKNIERVKAAKTQTL